MKSHKIATFRHLKFGSYPIITKNNNISVKNMYTKHDDSIIVTTITTYQSKNTTLVPIYGPQPGDWFVAAYMPYWNEKVQQQVQLFCFSFNICSCKEDSLFFLIISLCKKCNNES